MLYIIPLYGMEHHEQLALLNRAPDNFSYTLSALLLWIILQ